MLDGAGTNMYQNMVNLRAKFLKTVVKLLKDKSATYSYGPLLLCPLQLW